MSTFLLAVILTFLIAVLVILLCWASSVAHMKIVIISCIIVSVICILMSVYANRQSDLKWAAGFEAQKATIETSLKSDLLTGFERAQLVQQAAEANNELAQKQYYASRWYGFDSSDYVLTLEPVSLG